MLKSIKLDRCQRCGRRDRNLVLHGLREMLCTRCWVDHRRSVREAFGR